MTDIVGFTDDNTLSEADVQGVLIDAMEEWNRNTPGPALIFKGIISEDNPEETCNDIIKPAIFVNFSPGCQPDDDRTNCAGSSAGLVKLIPNCTSAVSLTIAGADDILALTPNTLFGGGNAGSCTQTSDCDSGFTCDSGTCRDACVSNSDCSKDNFVCDTSANSCVPRISSLKGWSIGSQRPALEAAFAGASKFVLRLILVHELGHTLGIGHAINASPPPAGAAMRGARRSCNFDNECDDAQCNDGTCLCVQAAGTCDATLASCNQDSDCDDSYCTPFTCSCNLPSGICETDVGDSSASLWDWDRQCSKKDSKKRLKYQRMSWQNLATHSAAPRQGPLAELRLTHMAFWGAGALVDGTYYRYPLLDRAIGHEDWVWMATVYSDGVLDYNSIHGSNYPYTSPYSYSMPTIRQPTGNASVVAQYVFQHPFGDTYQESFPPAVHVRTSSTGSSRLVQCLNSSCSLSNSVFTNVVVSTAHDPESGLDVTAYVAEDGTIRVAAGYDDDEKLSDQLYADQGTERLWSAFTTKPALSSSYQNWSYLGKTRQPVGLACAETSATGRYHNCILAWNDYGVPNGNILYSFFRVTNSSPKNIEWYTYTVGIYPYQFTYNQVWSVDFAKTNTGVTAAHFNNALHLAWRRAGVNSAIETVYNGGASNTFSSSFSDSYTQYDVVTGPTFTAMDGKESALIWTQAQP